MREVYLSDFEGGLEGLSSAFFTKQIKTYVLSDLASLFAALHYVFEQCRQWVEGESVAV